MIIAQIWLLTNVVNFQKCPFEHWYCWKMKHYPLPSALDDGLQSPASIVPVKDFAVMLEFLSSWREKSSPC
jgi:hypothetical protein